MAIVIFVIVLAVLVLAHELGHFVAARRNGVRVDEFGLGFPPRLFSIKGKQTLYSVNLIPLGGFVKIKGEAGEHKSDSDSFSNKKIWQRGIILSAGVLMNLLIAWWLISLGLAIGLPVPLDQAKLTAGAQIREINIQVASVLEGTPAAEAGFQPGDIIVSADGLTFFEVAQLQDYVSMKASQEIKVTLRRGHELLEVAAAPELLPEVQRHALGIGLVKTGIISYPWYTAVYRGLIRTFFITKEILKAFYYLFANLLSGQPIAEQLSGPVGVAVITGQVAKLGFIYILQFMAILSINLAIINFLPFPALDGGRMFFLAIEKARGRPVSKKLENALHNLGFALLILLMVLVTISDVGRYSAQLISGLTNFF